MYVFTGQYRTQDLNGLVVARARSAIGCKLIPGLLVLPYMHQIAVTVRPSAAALTPGEQLDS
jgi:hypothetical protein